MYYVIKQPQLKLIIWNIKSMNFLENKKSQKSSCEGENEVSQKIGCIFSHFLVSI